MENTYKKVMEETTLAEGLSFQGKMTKVNGLVTQIFSFKYLAPSLYVLLLLLLYIGNRHYVQQLVRDIEKRKITAQQVQTEYMEWETKYLQESRQLHVLQRAKRLGLQESSVAPVLIKKESTLKEK